MVEELEPGLVAIQLADDVYPWVDLERLAELERVVAELARDSSLRMVLVRGGERHFCSGATLEMLLQPNAAEVLSQFMRRVPELWFSLPVPTLAVMSGHALGGGWMAGLWCDLQLMSERALYGANFAALGISPGMGATQKLPQLFGESLAQELMYGARNHTGRELLARCPTLPIVVDVEAAALSLAEDVCAAQPAAIRALKALQVPHRRAMLHNALVAEEAAHARLLADPATRAALREAYPTRSEST